VAQQEVILGRIGQSGWTPDRGQLIEFEQVTALRKTAAADGLSLSALLKLVEEDIRAARRTKAIGLISLTTAIAAWKEAKFRKSEQHQQKCSLVYDHFARWFGGDKPISSVTAEDAERWSKSLQVSENTRTRYVGRLIGLWRWAEKPQRRWVTDNPWLAVETEPIKRTRPAILTVEQVAALLRTAASEPESPMLVFLVLALFAGPRVAETKRLDWSAVTLAKGEEGVKLNPEQTKTGSRRWIPLPQVAVAWLKFYRGPRTGPIAPTAWNFRRERLLARAGFRVKGVVSGKSGRVVQPIEGEPRWNWPRNGLRHSFCSYAVAHLRDLAEVSFRAGNSEYVLRRDYVAAVTQKEGDAYFALSPRRVLNRRAPSEGGGSSSRHPLLSEG
jgi:integrase